MIHIRPHHLLCIHGFRGKGYNEEFVENMIEIVKEIKENKKVDLNIVNRTDAICLKCPNKIGENLCTTQENIELLDRQVLDVLELTKERYSYKEILDSIKRNLTQEDFQSICSDCEWYDLEYCKDGLFRKE